MRFNLKKASGISALGLALGAAMMMAQPVAAAPVTFNFDRLADVEEAAWPDYENRTVDGGDFTDGVYEKGGISVVATGINSAGGTSYAYLDDRYQTRLAGLGVCSTGLNGDDCRVPADDNVGQSAGGSETLKLDFQGTSVSLSGLRFKDSEHYDFTGTVYVGNGTTTSRVGILNGNLAGTGLGFSSVWTFMYDATSTGQRSGSIPGYFYVAGATATIPLPAGVLLLGSALGGLGLMGRRRKAV